jgi:hypothetical protein
MDPYTKYRQELDKEIKERIMTKDYSKSIRQETEEQEARKTERRMTLFVSLFALYGLINYVFSLRG